MFFDAYLCHLLLMKYPALEKAMEEAGPAAWEIQLTEQEESRLQRQIDWLMMKDGPELPERLLSSCLFRYIRWQFQEVFQPWDYQYYPRHYQPPESSFLLELSRFDLSDARIQDIRCKLGHTVSLQLTGADCFYFGDACKVSLVLQFYGIPYGAYDRLRKMESNFEGYFAEERSDGRIQMLLFTGWDDVTYFTFRWGEVFLLED